MRQLFFLLFGFLSINCFGQDFNKLLDKSELDSLSKGLKIIKLINKTNCKDFDDFQGKMDIRKTDKKFNWHFTGIASKYNVNNKMIAQFDFDSIGQMITYQEYADNGEVIYDCTYNYKTLNGCYYRLEHIKLYYQPNVIREDWNRYVMLRDKNGENPNSSQHKYGKWISYKTNGEIDKSKDYGELK